MARQVATTLAPRRAAPAAAAAPTGIEAELQRATKVTRKAGEKDQDYLARLANGALTLPDKAWKALGKSAQDWANAASDATQANKAIRGFTAAAAGAARRVAPPPVEAEEPEVAADEDADLLDQLDGAAAGDELPEAAAEGADNGEVIALIDEAMVSLARALEALGAPAPEPEPEPEPAPARGRR